jgi:hypothetical protein
MDQVLAESDEQLKAILTRISTEAAKQSAWKRGMVSSALFSLYDAIYDLSTLRDQLRQEDACENIGG